MNKLIAVLGGLSIAQATTLNPLPAGWGDLGCVVEEAVWYPVAGNTDITVPVPGGRVRCPDNTDFTDISVQGTPTAYLNLGWAVLRGAIFGGDINLKYVNFQHADLSGAHIASEGAFAGINFNNANLEGATIANGCTSCSLGGTNLLHGTITTVESASLDSGTCLTGGCGADMCASAVASALATQCPVCPDTNGFIDPSDAGALADAVRANPTAYQQAGLCM